MGFQEQMLEAFCAAIVLKLADGELDLTVDDLLAAEGKVFQVEDQPDGFVIKVTDEE